MKSAVNVCQQIVRFGDELEAFLQVALVYFGLTVGEKVVGIGGFSWNVFNYRIHVEYVVFVKCFLLEIVFS